MVRPAPPTSCASRVTHRCFEVVVAVWAAYIGWLNVVGNASSSDKQMKVAMLARALPFRMGVIIELGVGLAVDDIAVRIMGPDGEGFKIVDNFRNQRIAGIAQNTHAFEHLTASDHHILKTVPRQGC